MNNAMYLQVIPDSQLYTNIDQLIETMKMLEARERSGTISLTTREEEIHYILVGLQNSKANGFNLIKN